MVMGFISSPPLKSLAERCGGLDGAEILAARKAVAVVPHNNVIAAAGSDRALDLVTIDYLDDFVHDSFLRVVSVWVVF